MAHEHLPRDIKRTIFEITHAVYRVTGLFPHEEVLAVELRRESSDVLKESAKYGVLLESTFEDIMAIIAKIRGLRALLWLARMNHFVSSANIDVLEREYQSIEEFFLEKLQIVRYDKKIQEKKHNPVLEGDRIRDANFVQGQNNVVYTKKYTETNVSEKKIDNNSDGNKSGNIRRSIIIQFLEKKDSSSIKDIARECAGVSTKTIQRDLQDLVEKNIVERTGDRRWAVYSLKKEGSSA